METIALEVNTEPEVEASYNWRNKAVRLHAQYQKLAKKLNYMNAITNMGRQFGRNRSCPCRSGKKFKHCCLPNHDANQKRVSQLQVAMTKLQKRAVRYGMEGIVT